MFVMTIDQKGSSHANDGVPGLLDLLRHVPTVVPFDRSVGDEAQGVLDSPEAVVDVALLCLRVGGWYVGIGVGGVDLPLPSSAREGRGSAFVAARSAVEQAKKAGDRAAVAVDGGLGTAEAEGVLMLIGLHVMKRTAAEWRVLDLLEPGKWGSQTAVARQLGITSQAVSKAVSRSAWVEEWAARPAAAVLLQRADVASRG
ncbi:MarR family transcriptional regulator [Arthrobacter sp. HLT1-21]